MPALKDSSIVMSSVWLEIGKEWLDNHPELFCASENYLIEVKELKVICERIIEEEEVLNHG